jgi:hypothetical protein
MGVRWRFLLNHTCDASPHTFVRSHFPPTLMATNAKETSQKPEKVFRLRGLSSSIFVNTAKSEKREITYRKVSLQRNYRDDDGEWKSTNSFGRDDLPTLQLLLQRSWEFILDTDATRNKDDTAE